MTAPLICLREIRHRYELGAERFVTALELDALDVAPGERLAIRGPNGSGKTTLLHTIAGLLPPSTGRVEIDGTNLYDLRQSTRDRFRARRVGYLLQSLGLLDALTNERIWIELEEPIEDTPCPVHITGEFVVQPGRTAGGDVLYRVVGARARVIALEQD